MLSCDRVLHSLFPFILIHLSSSTTTLLLALSLPTSRQRVRTFCYSLSGKKKKKCEPPWDRFILFLLSLTHILFQRSHAT